MRNFANKLTSQHIKLPIQVVTHSGGHVSYTDPRLIHEKRHTKNDLLDKNTKYLKYNLDLPSTASQQQLFLRSYLKPTKGSSVS